MEVVFWAAVAFMMIRGNSSVCIGTSCALGWVVFVLAGILRYAFSSIPFVEQLANRLAPSLNTLLSYAIWIGDLKRSMASLVARPWLRMKLSYPAVFGHKSRFEFESLRRGIEYEDGMGF